MGGAVAREGGAMARGGVRTASRGGTGREVAARCGLVARGVLYVLIGVLAVRVAFGGGGQEADRQGALQELAAQPFGKVLVWAVGVGIVCMMLWRLSEAVFGAAGPDGDKASKRATSAARAVFYGVVAFSVLSFAAGAGNRQSGDQQSRDMTSKAMELPGGQWWVGAAGVAIAVAGVVVAVQAARRTFRKHLAMTGASQGARKAVDVLGIAGGIARGTVFAAAGGFVVYAAVRFDPGQAKGMDDTLRSLAQTPAGPWLLVAVAAGLVLFGLFSWAMARWRRV
ncbi:membrane protein [Streptomyces subrutilus]|uniref:Membrane protein n=2 Tax=Streptomyces subrutilus TaxID=36818 RepID=A0A918QHV5_9ACTN|nr:membrane protein [Streptomyces subrutilus]